MAQLTNLTPFSAVSLPSVSCRKAAQDLSKASGVWA